MPKRDNEQTRRSRNPLPEPQMPEQKPEMPQQSVQRLGNCEHRQQPETKKQDQCDGSVGQR
jgi:hypothetical protein